MTPFRPLSLMSHKQAKLAENSHLTTTLKASNRADSQKIMADEIVHSWSKILYTQTESITKAVLKLTTWHCLAQFVTNPGHPVSGTWFH